MNKEQFIIELRRRLVGLPIEDIDRSVEFYGEMIDDRIEEGTEENEAVKSLGSIDDIVGQILSEIPISRIVKERIKPRRSMGAFAIVMLAIGSPVWLSLLIAAAAVIFSVYVSLWSVIIALWASFAAVVASAVGGLLASGVLLFCGKAASGVAGIAASLVLAGLSIFFFFGCREATKGMAYISKALWLCTKRAFLRKEEAI